MKIININGPINAGKTTVSTALAAKIPNTLFIEVDDLLSDSEQASLGLSREEGWQERIREMYQEGYHCSKFADLIIDNSVQTPQETVQTILLFL